MQTRKLGNSGLEVSAMGLGCMRMSFGDKPTDKQEMIDFLAATRGMDKHTAYQLTSIAGDVAITQLVDGTMGVHVKMPKGIFKGR